MTSPDCNEAVVYIKAEDEIFQEVLDFYVLKLFFVPFLDLFKLLNTFLVFVSAFFIFLYL